MLYYEFKSLEIHCTNVLEFFQRVNVYREMLLKILIFTIIHVSAAKKKNSVFSLNPNQREELI
jgi:hypothetical protein